MHYVIIIGDETSYLFFDSSFELSFKCRFGSYLSKLKELWMDTPNDFNLSSVTHDNVYYHFIQRIESC